MKVGDTCIIEEDDSYIFGVIDTIVEIPGTSKKGVSLKDDELEEDEDNYIFEEDKVMMVTDERVKHIPPLPEGVDLNEHPIVLILEKDEDEKEE